MMGNTWPLIFFGGSAVYFGFLCWLLLPTVVRLLVALRNGQVEWSGPRIINPTNFTNLTRSHVRVGYIYLFPSFFFSVLGLLLTFAFFLSMFLIYTPVLGDSVWINWTWMTILFIAIMFVGGQINFRRARSLEYKINIILDDIESNVEPRSVDGKSSRSAYAIAYPLHRVQGALPRREQALELFYAATTFSREGDQQKSFILQQEAIRLDPHLHRNAREMLLSGIQDCSPRDMGRSYYWLGIHSEYLRDLRLAGVYYEKATNIFEHIGYNKRASRACNNLGSIQSQMGDIAAIETLKRAIALHPANAMAYISLGLIYYRLGQIEEPLSKGTDGPLFEQAFDAFANAIVLDPPVYTPLVASHLHSESYTWKEALDAILERASVMLTTDADGKTTS